MKSDYKSMSKILNTISPTPKQEEISIWCINLVNELKMHAFSLFDEEKGGVRSKISCNMLVGQDKTELTSVISKFLFVCYFIGKHSF